MIRVRLLPTTKPSVVSQITIDPDPAGERLLVMHRLTAQVMWFGMSNIMSIGGVVTITLPDTFATSNELFVVLMDDGNTYDLTGTDKVQGQLVTINP